MNASGAASESNAVASFIEAHASHLSAVANTSLTIRSANVCVDVTLGERLP
jgi:hypothetical protein